MPTLKIGTWMFEASKRLPVTKRAAAIILNQGISDGRGWRVCRRARLAQE